MSRSSGRSGNRGVSTTKVGADGPEVFVTPDGRCYMAVPFEPKMGPNVRVLGSSSPPPSPATIRRVLPEGTTFSPATKPCPFGLVSLVRIDEGPATISSSKEWRQSLKLRSRKPPEG